LNEDSENSKQVSTPGSLEYDIPQKIVSAKMGVNKEVLCRIEWNKRYDGSIPDHSYISNKILKQIYPQLLIDYYESKLRTNDNK
jgi:hypothetical protein